MSRAKIRYVALPGDLDSIERVLAAEFRVISISKDYKRRNSAEVARYMEIEAEARPFSIERMAPRLEDRDGLNHVLVTIDLDYERILDYGTATALNEDLQNGLRRRLGPLQDVYIRMDQSRAPPRNQLVYYRSANWDDGLII